MQLVLTLRTPGLPDRDVRITAAPNTPLGAVVSRLAARFPATRHGLWAGPRLLPPDAELGSLGLLNATILSAGRAGERDTEAGAVIRLEIAGGPGAGQTRALPRGESSVGRSTRCVVALPDPRLSRWHATISLTGSGVNVSDHASTNGVRIDGHPVEPGGTALHPGAHVSIGDSTVRIANLDEAPASTRPGPDGTLLVNRSPRRRPANMVAANHECAPAEPRHPDRPRIPLLGALVPALGGVAFAVYTRQLLFLVLALASPLALAVMALRDRWRRDDPGRRRRRRARAAVRTAELAATAERLRAEATARRRVHPDAAALRRTAAGPGERVWERRRGDDDFLEVSLGFAAQPSRLDWGDAARPSVASVPVVVGLRTASLGICGPGPIRRAVAIGAVGQLATLHSPADLTLMFAVAEATRTHWTWVRWLPHLGPPAGDPPDQHQALVRRLLAETERRLTSRGHGDWPGPSIVVVFDLAPASPELTGLARLLELGPPVGITAIYLDERRQRLPTSCAAVATVTGDIGSRLRLEWSTGRALIECAADQVDQRWADTIGRALAPLRDGGDNPGNAIPSACRLLAIDELAPTTITEVATRWRQAPGPIATIGVGAEGPVTIDLAQDGPHVLIAGTTGAGKSELLRSLVSGLALNNSPDDLAFVLVDYKGGAAFHECARLPHCAGVVTDLDGHLANRVLRSLNAELRRRERLLAAVKAADLAEYRDHPHHQVTPIGRLVMVIDEFAALADEWPDLLGGLVAIAQRGRSLGVHLILATQRPGGHVTPDIQANMALRIALRVIDPAESMAVIGSPAAAAIDPAQPGRAFLRAGGQLRELQTGQVTGPDPSSTDEIRVELLDCWGRSSENEPPVGHPSELATLVDLLQAAANADAITPPVGPWLPPLPELLTAGDLHSSGPGQPAAVIYGLVDLPDEQRQDPLTLNLEQGGVVLVAGAARSGRSTALLAIADTATRQLPPELLQLYVVDCAGGALSGVSARPHCGAALTRDDPEAIGRLLVRLADEVALRQTQARPTPALLLVVDGWENLMAECDAHEPGTAVELMAGLLRDGPSAGLTIAIAGGRATLTNRLTGSISPAFVLAAGASADWLPTRPRGADGARVAALPPGRAIRVDDGSFVQFALPSGDPDLGATGCDPAPRPIEVRPLPVRVDLAGLEATGTPAPGHVLLGLGGDAGDLVTVDLFAHDGRWLVIGPSRSGRSTALVLIAKQSRAAGIDVVVAAERPTPLTERGADLGLRLFGEHDAGWDLRSGPLLVLVDDLETYEQTPGGQALLAAVTSAGPGQLAVVASGRPDTLATSYHGLSLLIRRSRTGILLQPTAADGDLLGVRLPRVRSSPPPGRALLVADQPLVRRLARGRGALPIQLAR